MAARPTPPGNAATLARIVARIDAREMIALSQRANAFFSGAEYVPSDLNAPPWRQLIRAVFEAEAACSIRR